MPPRGRDQEYVSELGKVLRSRNPSALRDFLADRARQFGDTRQASDIESKEAAELETLMHRMTLARPDLADLHPVSQRWLASRG